MRIWWRWLGISALLVCAIIPQWGVLAVPALVGALQLWAQQQPTRRNQLATLLMALPTPWAVLAPLGSQHAWWQRVVLVLVMAATWAPIDAEYRWALAIVCALWPLGQATQRDDVRWVIPLLQVAATMAWPAGWDVGLASIALVSGAWAWWRHDETRVQWSGVLLCLGLASGAGIVVLPWMLGARVLRAAPQSVLAVWAWWGLAMALLASGNVWGLALVVWPLLQTIQRSDSRLIRKQWPLLFLLLLFPVQASVARLQPSLLALGEAWVTPLAWQFRNAAQQGVGGVPWGPVLVCGVLAWAVWQLWQPAEAADVE